MNVKLKVDYIPDEDQDTILVRDISLSPREFFEPLKGNKSIYLNNGALCYTSSLRRFATKILCVGRVYRSNSFHARTRFIINLLKKWRLSTKEVEVPIKVTMPSETEWKQVLLPKRIKTGSEAKPKVKLRHSPLGIQVDVIRFSKADLYLVTRIQALTKEELPSIYTEEDDYGLPKVWQHKDALIIGESYLKDTDYVLLRVGKTYSYGQLKKALLYIELAGRHLEAANKHMKPVRPKWATSNVISFKDGLLLKDTTFQKKKESEGCDKTLFWLNRTC